MRFRAATRRFQIETPAVRLVAGRAPNRLYFGNLSITRQDRCLDLNDFTAGFPPLSRLYQEQSISCGEDRIHRSDTPIQARHTRIASRITDSTAAAGPAGDRSAGSLISGILVLNKGLPAGRDHPGIADSTARGREVKQGPDR